ncbi:unnamed protein product [Larinioides sclopetarius]|uniref:NADH dehydrogenase subunit 1 n=1 Tax=Larinioides sclopetarius TaxID=280406 RepID=A0AAV2A181_9ARAC
MCSYVLLYRLGNMFMALFGELCRLSDIKM